MTTVVAQTSSTSTLQYGGNSPTSFSSLRSRRSIDDDDELRHVTVDVSPISNSSRFTPRLPHSLASLALNSFRENPSDTDTDSEQETFRKRGGRRGSRGVEGDNFSVLALFVTALRKSVVRCYNTNNKGDNSAAGTNSVSSSSCSESSPSRSSSCSSSPSWGNKMEIGVPTNVRHVAHVTFDRFNGFLGLPVEFEPEVSRRAPSASAKVFGVSTNSMQLSFDSRGNSVPTILLMMQHRLYALGGLEVEGIFRINAGNDQEEYVRDQLNHGVVPSDADVHCLAGLIKAWFRELPIGLLDSLPTEQLMESQTEDECAQLARHLPPTEASLLDWAVNLMADIVQYEHRNKMNARNVAVVFAPNMTHVMDPLTALMHAVQVMNFLKTLIVRTLREREDSILDDAPPLSTKDHQFDETSRPQTPLQTIIEEEISDGGVDEDNNNKHICNKSCLDKDQPSSSHCVHQREELSAATKIEDRTTVSENSMEKSMRPSDDPCEETDDNEVQSTRAATSSNRVATVDKGQRTGNRRISQPPVAAMGRIRRSSNSAVNRRNPAGREIIESWR